MADLKSPVITGLDGFPIVRTQPWMDGRLQVASSGAVALSTAEDATDVIRLVRIASSARIYGVKLSCDALTSGAGDIGIYSTTGEGGAVVDADVFASARGLGSALVKEEVAHESGVFGIEKRGLRLWQVLGLTEDPKVDYDVALTVTTNIGGSGDIFLDVEYIDGH